MRNFKYFIELLLVLLIIMSLNSYAKKVKPKERLKIAYKLSLQSVEYPNKNVEIFGENKIVAFQDQEKFKCSYEDKILKIIWSPVSYGFNFFLTNKSDKTLKLIWDESVYVNENGMSGRGSRSGVNYDTKNLPQLPETIVNGASIENCFTPTSNLHLYVSDNPLLNSINATSLEPLFDTEAYSSEDVNKLKNKYIGKIVKILLPLRSEDTTYEYLFSFKIDDILNQINQLN